MSKPNTGTPTPPKRKKKKSVNYRQLFMVGFLMLAIVAFIFTSLPSGLFRSNNSSGNYTESVSTDAQGNNTAPSGEPVFKKEGELQFTKADGQPIRKINIEIADDDAQRNMGLMYRRSLPEDSGMLFLFDKNEPQSFWMKNTFISLDIIYINDQKEIVGIAKNTQPLSEGSIPSNAAAQYVLEMIGGYCDAYGIAVGDKVVF